MILLRQTTTELTNLQNAERNRALIVGVLIKDVKGISVTSNRSFHFNAIIPNVLDTRQIRRHHRASPFHSKLPLGNPVHLAFGPFAAMS